jgi:hypothetical protein
VCFVVGRLPDSIVLVIVGSASGALWVDSVVSRLSLGRVLSPQCSLACVFLRLVSVYGCVLLVLCVF